MRNYLLFLLPFLLFSCSEEKNTVKNEKVEGVNVYQLVDPDAGLNLQALGALIKSGSISDAKGLENALNASNGLNNLDLNGDGNTDYVNVKENSGTADVKSFDLYTNEGSQENHVATIEVQMFSEDNYQMNIAGNPNIYGQGSYYQDNFDVSDAAWGLGGFALGAWMFSDRDRYYHRPYHSGYYPSYYRPYRTVSRTVYRSRTQPVVKTSGFTKTKTSPLKTKSATFGKTNPSVKTKYSNSSTKNMKSMQKRDVNKPVKKGGFTKGKSSSKPDKAATNNSRNISKPKTSAASRKRRINSNNKNSYVRKPKKSVRRSRSSSRRKH